MKGFSFVKEHPLRNPLVLFLVMNIPVMILLVVIYAETLNPWIGILFMVMAAWELFIADRLIKDVRRRLQES